MVTVVCGGSSTSALTDSGDAFTWGSATDGALGRPCLPEAPEVFPGQVRLELYVVGLAGSLFSSVELVTVLTI